MKTLSLEEEPKTAQDYHCTDVGVGGAGWCSSGSGDGASAQTQRDAASAGKEVELVEQRLKQEWTAIRDLRRPGFFGFPLSRLFVSLFPGFSIDKK